MKKTLLLLLVTIVLAACGGDDSSEPNEEPVKEPDQSEEAGTDEGEKAEENDKEEAAEEETEADNSAIEEFDEYDIVADHIDLDAYTGIVETDNQGTRVILYEDENGEKEYKSIFVKNDSHLKIISLNDDTKPLYNDHIK